MTRALIRTSRSGQDNKHGSVSLTSLGQPSVCLHRLTMSSAWRAAMSQPTLLRQSPSFCAFQTPTLMGTCLSSGDSQPPIFLKSI